MESKETFEHNTKKARDVTLENRLEPVHIYEDPDPSFVIKHDLRVRSWCCLVVRTLHRPFGETPRRNHSPQENQ